MNRPGRLQRGYGGVEPLLAAGSGGRRGRRQRVRGRDPARAGPCADLGAAQQPPNPGLRRGARPAYAEVVRGDIRRGGGARARRQAVAVRRKWARIRSITAGAVMKATIRIS